MSRRDNIDAFKEGDSNPEGNDKKNKPSLLKGNYKLDKDISLKSETPSAADTSSEKFESFARERLGGSIAFVMKDNTFVWNGDDKSGPDKKTKDQ